LNKADLLPEGYNPIEELAIEDPAVVVSAYTGQGIEDLMVAIEAAMIQYLRPLHIFIPYKRGDLLALFHERGQVESEEHTAEGTRVYGRLPHRLLPYFEAYRVEADLEAGREGPTG
jgi:GTPase